MISCWQGADAVGTGKTMRFSALLYSFLSNNSHYLWFIHTMGIKYCSAVKRHVRLWIRLKIYYAETKSAPEAI